MNIPFKEKTLRNIIGNSMLGFLIFTKDYKVIFANEALEKLTDYKPEDFIGTNFFNLVQPDEQLVKSCLLKLESAFLAPFDDAEFLIKTKSGNNRYMHAIGWSFPEAADEYAILLIFDVTSRIAIEQVMESSYDNLTKTTIDLDSALKKIKEQRRILEEYQTKMKTELEMARNIQLFVIPKEFPPMQNVHIAGCSLPSAELGGDFIDYVDINDHKIGLIIADVSGHGVPAALITTLLKVQFLNITEREFDANKVFYQLNNNISNILGDTGLYLTAFYSVLDIKNMTITSACAAHEQAFYYDPEIQDVLTFGENSRSTVIGAFKGAEFLSETLPLKKGFKILFYTDGIVEVENQRGEFYGHDQLKAFLKEHHDLKAHDFIQALILKLNEFAAGTPPHDDRTLLVIDITEESEIMTKTASTKVKIDKFYQAGRTYLKKKDYQAAINEFLNVLNYDNEAFGAYSYLGQIFCLCEEWEQAKKYLIKTIDLNPDYYQGYYYLGIVLYRQKQYKEAKQYWLKLRERIGDFKRLNEFIKKLKTMGY